MQRDTELITHGFNEMLHGKDQKFNQLKSVSRNICKPDKTCTTPSLSGKEIIMHSSNTAMFLNRNALDMHKTNKQL